ncbi:hypothetical protein NDU88_007747 [Pleurodeles waltl]|uniref:Uncharacterized protein n=1 Tax=Pleurodeles waltl TaxID=8319 RepID=A0AAV7NU69_PLEWA|nr:hypothetical protein NDU88_007747 [Pleurodeles waltl]
MYRVIYHSFNDARCRPKMGTRARAACAYPPCLSLVLRSRSQKAGRSPAPYYAYGAAPSASFLAALSRGIPPVIRGGESFPPLSLRLRPLLHCGTGWRPKSGVGVVAEPAPSLRVGHLAPRESKY